MLFPTTAPLANFLLTACSFPEPAWGIVLLCLPFVAMAVPERGPARSDAELPPPGVGRLLAGAGLGAALLVLFSLLSRNLFDGPMDPASFAVPVLFGASTGLLIGWLFDKSCRHARQLEQAMEARRTLDVRLLRSENEWATTFDALPDLVFLLDRQHRVIRANKACEQAVGQSAEEIAGKKCFEVMHAGMRPVDECPHAQTLLDRKEHATEFYHEGLGKYLYVTTSPIFDEQGQLVASVHVARDVTALKEAEADARHQGEKLKLALEGTRAGIWDWDHESHRIQVDERYAEILGYAAGDLEPTEEGTFDNLLHPGDKDAAFSLIRRVLDGLEESYDQEVRLRHRDGHYLDIHTRGKIVGRDGEGKPTRIVGTIVDITRRKEAERRLAQSEERYRLVVETQNEIICTWLPDTTLTFANGPYARFFGSGEGDLAERQWIEFLEPEDRDPVLAFIQQMITTRQPKDYEHQLRRDDGELRWILWRDIPIVGDDGTVLSFLSTGIDITERRRAERALELGEERFRLIAENTSDGIVVYEDGVIAYVSAGFTRIFGYTSEDLLGIRVEDRYDGIHPDDREPTRHLVQQAVADQRTDLVHEFRIRHKDGHYVWREDNMRLTYRENGELGRVYIVARDITERRRAQEALELSEQRFRLIAENTSDGIAVFEDDQVSYASPEYCRLHGFDEAEFIGMTQEAFFERLHPDDRESLFTQWQESLRERRPSAVRAYRIRHREGHYLWREDHTRFIYDKDGRLQRAFVVTRDITERRRAEQALQLSEERFRLIAENTGDGIAVFEDGVISYVSPAYIKILGYTMEEEIGRNEEQILALLHPADRDRIMADIVEARSVRRSELMYRYRIRHKEGHYVWREDSVRLVYTPDGSDVRRAYIVAREVTDQVATEQALQRVTEFRRLIGEISTEFLAIASSETDAAIYRALARIGAFTAADRAYVFLYRDNQTRLDNTHEWCAQGITPQIDNLQGLRPDDIPWFSREILAGRPIHLPTLDHIPEHDAATRAVLEPQDVQSLLALPLSHRGQVIGFLGFDAVAAPRHWSEEDQSLLSLVGQVISSALERRRVEHEREELENQYRQAQKMEAIGRLAGGIAHDINNILQGIYGFTQMAEVDLHDPPVARAHLHEVHGSIDRAAALIRQLLAFSRSQILQLAHHDLAEITTSLARMLDRILGDHIVLDLRTPTHPLTIRADRTMIEQIILNLAINSRDAMPHGGTLTITCDRVTLTPADTANHKDVHPGPHARLRVADTGTGMDPQTLERAFEPFFTTKDREKGTGLGLSTVFGNVQQHKGLLHAESQPGHGTTITVHLPLADAAPRTPGNPAEAPERVGRETILLAEDNTTVRDATTAILQRAGYTVLPATDGRDALQLYRQTPRGDIHLLLFDLLMPNMGGLDAAREIRRDNPTLPLLFASGYSDQPPDAQDDSLLLGARYLAKPYTRDALLQTLREILDTAPGVLQTPETP